MSRWMDLYQRAGRILSDLDETGAYEEDPQARKAYEGLLVTLDALGTMVHREDDPDAEEVDSFDGHWTSALMAKIGEHCPQVGDKKQETTNEGE